MVELSDRWGCGGTYGQEDVRDVHGYKDGDANVRELSSEVERQLPVPDTAGAYRGEIRPPDEPERHDMLRDVSTH